MSGHRWITVAALSGLSAVMLGAFGAHWLNDTGFLEQKYADADNKVIAGMTVPASYASLRNFETAVQYQLTHSAALLVCGLLLSITPLRMLNSAAWCFFLGITIFSGSLYLLVIAGPRWGGIPWGAVVPIGGTLMIVGWSLLAISAWKLHARRSASVE